MHPATKRRFEELKRRKNFLPTLLVSIILWIIVGIIVYFTDPFLIGAIPLFFVTEYCEVKLWSLDFQLITS